MNIFRSKQKQVNESRLSSYVTLTTVKASRSFSAISAILPSARWSEAKIRRHTQLYAALSQCNKAIVHCTSEEELFPQVCRAAVQFGGMKMAWVGLIDTETRMVRPAASFGDDTAYLQAHRNLGGCRQPVRARPDRHCHPREPTVLVSGFPE